MKHVRIGATLGLSLAAVMFSPVVLIFFVPLAVGIGLDLLDLVGEMPFVVALGGAGAVLLLRWVSARSPVRRCAAALARVRMPFGRSGELDYAP